VKSVHILIVDPIAFLGGSKIATSRILRLLDQGSTRVTIVTKDPSSWHGSHFRKSPLFEANFLAGKEQGIGYFLRHFLIVFSLIRARIKFGRIDVAVGASGPGTDLSLYLARKLLGYDIVQLIHGPVACSRTIGWALLCATSVFYLQSTRCSLVSALKTFQPDSKISDFLTDRNFRPFSNGISPDQWPGKCSSTTPKIFWAASLLKWKGLETLLETLKVIPAETRPESHICYIRPRSTNLEIGPNPIDIEKVHWHENPSHLNQIRSECNIFISTSRSEPFGLSILESMAAGLAIVIPRDGAYWDQCLLDKVNCLKYRADDPVDLALKILYLQQNPEIIDKLGRKSKQIAQQYHTETVYQDIAHCLTSPKRGASYSRFKSYQDFDHAQV